MIASLYAAVARRRREWYAAHPEARHRLRRPVISIGNIAAGGRGKTPFTAAVSRMLLELGERPAILSRGYARTEADDGVVIVRDALGIRADVARAGDEPFMLARQLPGVVVLTSANRYLAGRLADASLMTRYGGCCAMISPVRPFTASRTRSYSPAGACAASKDIRNAGEGRSSAAVATTSAPRSRRRRTRVSESRR